MPKIKKIPFRKRKGLLFPAWMPNLLGDDLVKKSIDVCNVKPKFLGQFDSPEHIFTEDYRWVPLHIACFNVCLPICP